MQLENSFQLKPCN